MARLRGDMDRTFDAFCQDLGLPSLAPPRLSGLTVTEESGCILVRILLPGLRVEDIDLHATERVLTLRGRREEQFHGVLREQIVQRRIDLPCRIRPDEAKAVYAQDVLEISLPKAREGCSQTIAISCE